MPHLINGVDKLDTLHLGELARGCARAYGGGGIAQHYPPVMDPM